MNCHSSSKDKSAELALQVTRGQDERSLPFLFSPTIHPFQQSACVKQAWEHSPDRLPITQKIKWHFNLAVTTLLEFKKVLLGWGKSAQGMRGNVKI